VIKGSVAGFSKLPKLFAKLSKLLRLASQIEELVETHDPDQIVIEEIAGSKNRLGQKTLDGLHFLVLLHLKKHLQTDSVYFLDVGGNRGWRPFLNMRLSDEDKKHNRKARRFNKKVSQSSEKLQIIGWKHLSCAFVNLHFGLDLDCDLRKTDGDIADAVCVGHVFISKGDGK